MKRRANTQTVQWFLEVHAAGQLDLEPEYQRRSVWNQDYRQFFIDTVLRDYPAPPIYLQIETKPGAPTVYHVIDGKQRLESILLFANDEFHLGRYAEDLGLEAGERYFSRLPAELKQAFVDYSLTVENISQAAQTELKAAFDRLNRNVAKLNSQELRNAQFEGAFITKMTGLSDEPFWTDIGVATKARVRRMKDVEFVSELYVLTMHGVQDGTGSLDRYYALYEEYIPDEQDHDDAFHAVLGWLRDLPVQWRTSRFRNLGDLYGLWAAVLALREDGGLPAPDVAAERLAAFEADVEALSDDRARRYSDAVRQGTNKDTNRKERADMLTEVLTGQTAPANP